MRKTFDKKLLNLTDAELVNKVLSGDKTAECELIHRYYSAIRTTVRFQLGVNHSNWEDIFQDVLIRLLELFRNGKFEPDRGTTVKSFINGVIRKLVLEFRRRENKSGLQSAISIPAEIELLANATSEGSQMVASAVNKPGGKRAVKMQLVERYIDELDKILGSAKITVLPEGMANVKAFFEGTEKLIKPIKDLDSHTHREEGRLQ